jgi:short subunit dehydrogenase-like uncharacterized protein
VCVAAIDDAAALDKALLGADAVIHAAGPFSITSTPMLQAAQRVGVSYLDVAAEADVVEDNIFRYAESSANAGIAFAPAMAFYGALGHLIAAAALDDWTEADSITLACALSSWRPTEGTRATIEVNKARRHGRRLRFTGGRLEMRDDNAPVGEWDFPAPLGRQRVAGEFVTADSLTLSQRFRVPEIAQYMTLDALKNLSEPGEPEAVDATGRSAQTFLIQAEVRRGKETRSAIVRGQDIYAVTAPLVVEAAIRLVQDPQRRRGLVTASDLGPAREFLDALAPDHLEWEIQ